MFFCCEKKVNDLFNLTLKSFKRQIKLYTAVLELYATKITLKEEVYWNIEKFIVSSVFLYWYTRYSFSQSSQSRTLFRLSGCQIFKPKKSFVLSFILFGEGLLSVGLKTTESKKFKLGVLKRSFLILPYRQTLPFI